VINNIHKYLDVLPIGIVGIDPQGRINIINNTAKQILNLNQKNSYLSHQVDQVISDSPLKTVLDTKKPRLRVKKQIKDRILMIDIYPVFSNGELVGAIELFQDYKKYDEVLNKYRSLKDFNLELQAIIENSSDGIFVTDGNGNVLTLNPASKKSIGITDEREVIGRNIDELEQSGLFSSSATRQALQKRERVTLLQTTKSGEKIIVTSNPVFDDKKEIVKVICNSRNITEVINLKEQLSKEKELTEFYKRELDKQKHLNQFVFKSSSMIKTITTVKKIADYDTTVMLLGESGVGKNVIAELIHKLSPRNKNPLIHLNCGAIPFNLLESELFGYEGGAFSGAKREGNIGKIELADKGTLFLDEIAELPLPLQAKILHVINEKKFMRVGGKKSVSVDIRVMSATNKDLDHMVRTGEFRQDLYYRLNVIKITIPPLRERKEDIPHLIKHFTDYFNKKYHTNKYFSSEALNIMQHNNWPGNIRELKNVVEQLIILSENNCIGESCFSFLNGVQTPEYNNGICNNTSLDEQIENMEKQTIMNLYKELGSSYKVAKALNISQSTASRKIRRYSKTE
jgi:PAS domain S-box-containing protein